MSLKRTEHCFCNLNFEYFGGLNQVQKRHQPEKCSLFTDFSHNKNWPIGGRPKNQKAQICEQSLLVNRHVAECYFSGRLWHPRIFVPKCRHDAVQNNWRYSRRFTQCPIAAILYARTDILRDVVGHGIWFDCGAVDCIDGEYIDL